MRLSSVRSISMLAVVVVVGVLTGGQAVATEGNSDNITFCHRTNSVTNPYEEITTDPAGIFKEDADPEQAHHERHTGDIFDGTKDKKWGDIIPAFGDFAGLNVLAVGVPAGEAWLARHCAPAPDLTLTHLTLVKEVVNTIGGTADASAWTLKADGLTNLSGKTGEGVVTNASVKPGDYALSESDGPSGYTASTWSCKGKAVTNGVVNLADGDSVTCTITNTYQSPDTVWVCKITGGLGNYSVKEGQNPIEVSENALNELYPGIGNQFSDAQPSYLVESEHAVCAVPPVDREALVTAPIFTEGTCLAPGSVVPTETVAYKWTTSGPDNAKVHTAVAKPGYTLTGTTSWTFDVRHLSGPVCSVVQSTPVTAPTFTAGTCLAPGKVVAPETVAYRWTITGTDNAKVYTAVAKAGFTLTGKTSWTFDLRKLPTQTVNPLGACYVAPAALDAVQVLGVSETAPEVAGVSQSLAFTGAAGILPLGIAGLLALALGAVLTAAARRRVRS